MRGSCAGHTDHHRSLAHRTRWSRCASVGFAGVTLPSSPEHTDRIAAYRLLAARSRDRRLGGDTPPVSTRGGEPDYSLRVVWELPQGPHRSMPRPPTDRLGPSRWVRRLRRRAQGQPGANSKWSGVGPCGAGRPTRCGHPRDSLRATSAGGHIGGRRVWPDRRVQRRLRSPTRLGSLRRRSGPSGPEQAAATRRLGRRHLRDSSELWSERPMRRCCRCGERARRCPDSDRLSIWCGTVERSLSRPPTTQA